MLLASFLLCAVAVLAASPSDWRSRSIYQVFVDRFALAGGSTTAPCDVAANVYCGGTWQGLIEKLDYIKNMGFTAIWISPVTHQIDSDSAFHGYYQDDLYTLNDHFGTEDDLKAVAKAVHDRGMYLMVDIVVNHFGLPRDDPKWNWTELTPFDSQEYFHPACPITDYTNQTEVEQCWVAYNTTIELPDVDTTRQDVKDIFSSWIRDLVSTYSIDGLRIDTVRHVQKDFWRPFNDAAGVYCVGEVFDPSVPYVCDYQNVMDGLLNYPLFSPIRNAFQNSNGSMSDLASAVDSLKSTCLDSTLLAPFTENHDNPRFPNLTSDVNAARNAIAFGMLADGIPIIYQGQEQHFSGGMDPNDREALWLSGYNTAAELYTFIAVVNQIRNVAIARDSSYLDYKAWPVYTDEHTIAMRKGFDGSSILAVFTNTGTDGASHDVTISSTGYSAGSKVLDVVGCNQLTVNGDGSVSTTLSGGRPQVLYPVEKLSGTGVCQFFQSSTDGDEQQDEQAILMNIQPQS